MSDVNTNLTIVPHLSKETISVLTKIHWEMDDQADLLYKMIGKSSVDNNQVLAFFRNRISELQKSIKASLEIYARTFTVGRWALEVTNLDSAIITKFLDDIIVDESRTPEELWSYAGLILNEPDTKKQVYNVSLKHMCVEIGRIFVKDTSYKNNFYTELYLRDYLRRTNLNKEGAYATLAKQSLSSYVVDPKKEQSIANKAIYEKGLLPENRISVQSQRYAVKIFLAHWHAVAYRDLFHKDYVSHHKNIVPVPRWPFDKSNIIDIKVSD